MTRILQVTEDHSPANTGITSAIDDIVRQLIPTLPQTVLSTGDETVPLPAGVEGIRLVTGGLARSWRAAPGSRQALTGSVQKADVIHLHGVWMWVQWAAARAARQQGKPFVISTRGMLEPWIWQRQRWPHRLKKWLYWQTVAYPAFRHAGTIHAAHPREAKNLRSYFPGVPIEVIPLSVDLEAIDRLFAHTKPDITGEPYLLFMGRIHPVKGLDLLIQAFSRLESSHFRLKIAGPVQARDADYAAQLRQQVERAGLRERVDFLGPVSGEQKWKLYRNAWVFCLPSHSEGIGMVNLEAAACRTPVITTTTTGLLGAWAENGGLLVDPEVDALAQALEQAQRWTMKERAERGENLYRLIESSYSWKATTPQWINLYQGLAGKS